MPHIVKSFDEELARLQEAIRCMGERTAAQVEQAVHALASRDPQAARKVIEDDVAIDDLGLALNEQVVRLLALRSPLADDLRLAVTALKVASTLASISDYAVGIAQRALALNELPPLASVGSIKHMGGLVHGRLTAVLEAYLRRDPDKAMAVWAGDREIDELYSALFRELLTYMMEAPRAIAPVSHLMFVAKNVERIGDHATNIAELVFYLVTGRSIEAERPKGDTSSFATGREA